MNEPKPECKDIPGRSWPGASFYKSLKLGWHWRRLRWAVVAASEAAQGHGANGLPPGSREFRTLFTEVASKARDYSVESGDPSSPQCTTASALRSGAAGQSCSHLAWE